MERVVVIFKNSMKLSKDVQRVRSDGCPEGTRTILPSNTFVFQGTKYALCEANTQKDYARLTQS